MMELSTKEFKRVCSPILSMVSPSEALGLDADSDELTLSVSSNNYFLTSKFKLRKSEKIKATVNATRFLKLVAGVDDSVESINVSGNTNYISFKAGASSYKIPLETLEMRGIEIGNPTVSMTIDGNTLNNILAYNTQELLKYGSDASSLHPVQTMYYIDQNGCLTFTDGACVNSFALEKPIRVLLDQGIVKLFKLFKGESVRFSLGHDPISETLVQTKVRFETDGITLTAITSCNDSLLTQVPAEAIRGLAGKSPKGSVVVDKSLLSQAFGRLLLFAASKNESDSAVGRFAVNADGITICWRDNEDFVKSEPGSRSEFEYSFGASLKDIKDILGTVEEQFITINYGDGNAIVILHAGGMVRNVVPEAECSNG